jgi:hypothetical protein
MEPDGSSRAGRVIVETLAGFGGEIGVGFVGVALADVSCNAAHSGDCTLAAAGGLVLGADLGAALGVYAAGRSMDGDGRLGPTLLGSFGGGAAGVALAMAMGPSNGYVLIPLVVLPLAGSIVGFETTSSLSAKAVENHDLRVTVLPTTGGGALSVFGRF